MKIVRKVVWLSLIAIVLSGALFGLYMVRKELTPKKELAVYVQMDNGLFAVNAVAYKNEWSDRYFSNRLECMYIPSSDSPAILDTLYGNVLPARVLELGTVFFGVMTSWDYYPKSQYGVLLPEVLRDVYYSSRSGRPVVEGYVPTIKLQVAGSMALEYDLPAKLLSLYYNNDRIDGVLVVDEVTGIINTKQIERAINLIKNNGDGADS